MAKMNPFERKELSKHYSSVYFPDLRLKHRYDLVAEALGKSMSNLILDILEHFIEEVEGAIEIKESADADAERIAEERAAEEGQEAEGEEEPEEEPEEEVDPEPEPEEEVDPEPEPEEEVDPEPEPEEELEDTEDPEVGYGNAEPGEK